MQRLLFVFFVCFVGSMLHADGRVLDTPTAPHPQAEITRVDALAGVATYRWLDANGAPVDSGNSIARFTPSEPVVSTDPATGEETTTIPDVDDATLLAAILAPEPAPTLTQSIETVLGRLTDAEFTALIDSADVRVRRFIKIAEMRGRIRSDHPDTLAAVQLLDALDIIAAERWPTLLAP